LPISFVSNSRRWIALLPAAGAISLLVLLSGCSRFRHEHHDTVYVSARQMYLHDRVNGFLPERDSGRAPKR